MAISKERLKMLERRQQWAEDNPTAYVAKEIAMYLCVTFGIALFMFLVLTPHPQHVQVMAHCQSIAIINNTVPYFHLQENTTPTFSNCTIEANATVWISEEQIVANKTGLP